MPRPSRKLTKEEIASVRTNPPKVMNSTQAGAYIGFSARTVGDLIRTDKTFPAKRFRRLGEWKILLVELDAWLSAQTRQPKP
jgi:hypothetical protein